MNTKFNKISTLKDSLLEVNYDLLQGNAVEVSKSLKDTLKSLKIDYKKYNSSVRIDKDEEDEEETRSITPPNDIYEYQNFFLLKRNDGKTVLLDGFRRLLWYKTPNTNILFRVYNQSDISDKQLLRILISLNHTKFFGGIGDYFDRGFALALKVSFDLDILKYHKVFHAYVSDDEIRRSSSRRYKGGDGEQSEIDEIVPRLLSNKFVEDMKFVQYLVGKNIMLNSNFGVLLWNTRKENPDFVFNASDFEKRCNSNKHIIEMQDKFKKVGDYSGAENMKAINRLIELYTNVFNEMLGKSIGETYLELKEKAQKIALKLRKDKSLIKVNELYKVEKQISTFIKEHEGKSPKFIVLVHPHDSSKDWISSFDKVVKKPLLNTEAYDDFYIKEMKYWDDWNGRHYDFVIANKNNTAQFSGRKKAEEIETTEIVTYHEDKYFRHKAELFMLEEESEHKVIIKKIKTNE